MHYGGRGSDGKHTMTRLDNGEPVSHDCLNKNTSIFYYRVQDDLKFSRLNLNRVKKLLGHVFLLWTFSSCGKCTRIFVRRLSNYSTVAIKKIIII